MALFFFFHRHLYASTVGMRKQRKGVGATFAAMGVGKTVVTEVIAILVLSYLNPLSFLPFLLVCVRYAFCHLYCLQLMIKLP